MQDHPAQAQVVAQLQVFRDMSTEAVERMPLGFLALDDLLQVTYANPIALELTGVSLTGLIGRRPWDLFPQIVGTRYQTVKWSAAITVEYEEQLGAAERWVGVIACPTRTGIAVFMRDVTQRKRAEETIRRSVALLHGSLDAMLDAFVLCSAVRDEQGAIVNFQIDFANSMAGEFLGRVPDEMTSTLLPDWAPDLDGLSFLEACRVVVDTGDPLTEGDVDYDVPGLDGEHRRGVLSIQIVQFADGFFATWRDVTEAQLLSRERERLAAALEQTIDGVAIADAEGIVTYANPAFRAAYSLGDDVVGRSALIVAGGLLGRDGFGAVQRAAINGTSWLQEIDRTGADGTTKHLQISMTPVRGDDSAVTSYVVVARDVTDLREAEAELALEARIRLALSESLNAIPDEASVEQAAQAICDEVVKLPFVDMAAIQVFLGAEEVKIIGLSAPDGFPQKVGMSLPAARARRVREQARVGPWSVYAGVDSADGGWSASAIANGLKAYAYGSIVRRDEPVGALVIGTFDAQFARWLVEKMPAVVSFSATSSALLAERMRVLQRSVELRTRLEVLISESAFHPVFQPIVDFESSEVVGYEALTRFDSGQRPDLCFNDAWSVGLGPDLEIATIHEAIKAARQLPPGQWLNLNVSPRLLGDSERLKAVLWSADRPIVLEVTEHEAIDDYGRVRRAVADLGRDMRLAVDDAGAGVANFGHIIELRPDFVKLDISLVRRVNANLGRQAMVIGMRHFSRTAGCRLIAEGVETPEEARTLAELGVDFGQGYLFGHPENVEVWAAAPGTRDGDGQEDPAPAVRAG